MSVQIAFALVISLVSALALNWGYVREHEAARTLPPLSIRQPWRTARLLLASRRWLIEFASEAAGWGLFVLALALAPLALVQATAVGGIGILAALVVRFRPAGLSARDRVGVGLSIAGLALLAVSLAGGAGASSQASLTSVALWLVVSAAAAAAAVAVSRAVSAVSRGGSSGGAAFGVATGVVFAAGDVTTKAAVGGELLVVPPLILCYAAGTILLQMGFQRGGALVTAGLATLLTNMIPIVAGMTIFHEPLPDGALGVLRIAAFAAIMLSAVLLARDDGAVPADRRANPAGAAPRSPRKRLAPAPAARARA
jgi:hypothetical protein